MKLNYKNANKISFSFFLSGILIHVSSYIIVLFFNENIREIIRTVLDILGLFFVCIAVIIPYRYRKCPYCDTSFASLWSEPEYCPACGKKL